MTHLLNNLALCLKRRGELAEATELIREAVSLEIPVYGPDHPLVLIGKNNLAGVLFDRGEYEQAEQLYREVAAIRLERSPNGVGTGSTLYYLGWTLMELGRFEEADSLIRDGLEIRRQHIREDHPAVLGVYNVLGSLALEVGDLALAEAHFQRVSAAFEAKQEDGHPRALVARCGLGSVLGKRAKYQEAKALLSEVLAAQREASPTVDVATTLDTLGGVLLRSGAPVEAAGLLRESLRLRINEQPEMHPHTARTQRYLGEVLTALGDLDEAEGLLSRALAAQRVRLPPQHPQIVATWAALDDLRSARQGR